MVYLHTNPSRPIPFEDRQEAEQFAAEKQIDSNLCILHEDGRVLSFKRKGDKEFSVITRRAE